MLKKNSLAFRLQIKPDFVGAQRALKIPLKKRIKIQKNLKIKQASVWNLRAFLGRAMYSRISQNKKILFLGFKLKKVFLKGVFFLQASNIFNVLYCKKFKCTLPSKSVVIYFGKNKKKTSQVISKAKNA